MIDRIDRKGSLLGLCSRSCLLVMFLLLFLAYVTVGVCYGIVISVPPNFLHEVIAFKDFPWVCIIFTHLGYPVFDCFNVRLSLIVVACLLRLSLSLCLRHVSRSPRIWLLATRRRSLVALLLCVLIAPSSQI